jgi:hypothetical protein
MATLDYVQIAYGSADIAEPGQPAMQDAPVLITQINAEASAVQYFGHVAAMDTSSNNGCILPASATADELLGIVMRDITQSAETDLNAALTGVNASRAMAVATKGTVWVTVVDGCTRGDRLHVVKASGACRASADSTNTIDATAKGRYLTNASAGGLAKLEFDFSAKA